MAGSLTSKSSATKIFIKTNFQFYAFFYEVEISLKIIFPCGQIVIWWKNLPWPFTKWWSVRTAWLTTISTGYPGEIIPLDMKFQLSEWFRICVHSLVLLRARLIGTISRRACCTICIPLSARRALDKKPSRLFDAGWAP